MATAWSASMRRPARKVWHYQLVHHGLWDYDTPAAPNLIDITVDGKPIKAVAQVTKQAFVYVFDRVTGQPVWPIEERPVPPSNVPGEQRVEDAAVSDQTCADRHSGRARRGPDRSDAGDSPRRRSTSSPNTITAAVHAAVGARHDPGARRRRRRQLGRCRDRSGDRHALCRHLPAAVRCHRSQARGLGGRRTISSASSGICSGPRGLPLLKPPFGSIVAIDMNSGEHRWRIPVGRGELMSAIRQLGVHGTAWDFQPAVGRWSPRR